MAGSYSIVEYYSQQAQRECGYCDGMDTNQSHGMWAHYLTVQDYQDLIDRGWRRSGCYCYKPTMDRTCCPMYTIRCEALKFQITKSQKKILKKITKFLKNESQDDHRQGDESATDVPDDAVTDIGDTEATRYAEHRLRAEKNVSAMRVDSVESKAESETRSSETKAPSVQRKTVAKVKIPADEGTTTARETTQDLSRPPPKKAKILRMERKRKKLLAHGKSAEEIDALFSGTRQNVAKTVENLMEEMNGGIKKLETKLVRVMSDEFLETLDESAKLYQKYQMTIHKNTPSQCDKKSFINFLVKSPLQHQSPSDGPPQGYGSFHEQYWLDGQLIAVAVLDVLPRCVSSVYFFYDPDYSFLSLGTFSSLREVCLTRRLNTLVSSIEYYYMGFYIHSNVKMRYKARIKPSKLLCPETYVWCDLDRSVEKINTKKYSRLNEDLAAIDRDGVVDIEKVAILHRHRAITYGSYQNRNEEDDEQVREYASVVGAKCAQRILLYRE